MNEPSTNRPEPRRADVVARLRAVYDELDAKVDSLHARHERSRCRECGTCCTFPTGAPVLYATDIEHTYLVSEPPPLQVGLPEGTCPYFEVDTSYCTARERRTISCRTHFCDDAMPVKKAREEAQALCEWALDRLREISVEFDLGWDYGPVIDRL
jgi:hypothetical protein